MLGLLWLYSGRKRRPLQDISASSSNITNFTWAWDSSKTTELLSGMGVSLMDKELLDTENTPQEQILSSSPPQKRQRVAERDSDHTFMIARRPRQNREATRGVSWEVLPDELFLSIFSYLPLTTLLKVSRVCKRWHRLSFDESLWSSLDLTGKSLLPGVIGQVLSAGIVAFRCPRACVPEPLFKNSRPLRIQHMDLSNCTISVATLQSILCRCHKIQNLSLEGLVLSDDILRSIAQNSDLVRLNLAGCSGFSSETLEELLSSCPRLEELNVSWCDFTADHIKGLMNHIPASVTQLNISGYRQNLNIADIKLLVERCPNITNLDLSDSVMLTSECFPDFHQLLFLSNLSLSRCYQISPATLLELGKLPMLKSLGVFGIVTDSSLQLLKETLAHLSINCSHFTTIARPTVGNKKNRDIWGVKCRLTFRQNDGL
ncbi:S-phase kinase-associated protein 2 isoform X2 [Ambystoma mexicanum]|uniref:S-phase kinase-associated protein 2 isoform X2 n=1 Tax=Ambystoma mexicanum TaxID=8296 RepID=UPI0037E79988